MLSCVCLFVTPWAVACQASLSMEFSRQEYWRGSLFPSPGVLPNPGIKPRSSTLWVNYFPAEPQGKPKNTGVSSLSLLQWIFLTQESNRGLLHCSQILNQLSYQGSLTTPRQLSLIVSCISSSIAVLIVGPNSY